ncbi:MAG: DUF349 domain-containing protein [Oxalobacter sp.]|nr:DUF349 domain-containing protein [Oxalobacter sp.]
MFDFLLQRFGKKQPDSISFSEEKKNARQAAANEVRQAAIQQAEALPDDENEAAAFILQSSSADARFIAAQKVHSKVLLEQIRNALRNTDRRVTRLVQSRLDALSQREKQQEQILACVDLANHLKNEVHLLPNLVADLDRQWDTVKKADADDAGLVQQYEAIRDAIGQRLSDQAALQREVMDTLSALRQLEEEEAALTPPEREARLTVLLALSENRVQSREWTALPRHLINDVDEAKERLAGNTQQHRQNHEALAVRIEMLAAWESADLSTLTLKDLQQQWRAFPVGNDDERLSDLQARFDALAARVSRDDRQEHEKTGQKLSSTEIESLFAYSLSLMKKAIEEGSVREATQQSERITHLDFSVFEPSFEQKAMLVQLRSELRNLADWARWGGHASREQLLRIVEALPGKNYPLEELAAAVVDAREKWKALNESSGMASKSQWQQFDAACNHAYEPVMEYARSQAVAREQNKKKAQALVDSAREILSTLKLPPEENEMNWRSLVEYQRQVQRTWQQIGPITRKEKKRLNAELDAVMHPLDELLKEETKIEVQRRKELIEEVRNLEPQDKKSGRMARQLQEKWQERARAFPLDSREDEKLWQQFRSASEAIFAHRSKLNEVAEKERLDSLREKEKLCENLETNLAETVGKIQQALREADGQWRGAGPVPKEQEGVIQERYNAAVEALLSRMRTMQEEEKNRRIAALIEKLSICQKGENALPDQPELADELKSLWESQPSDEWKKMLRPRFDAALNALAARDAAYVEALKSRQSHLSEQLLRLEIAAAIDSPPEFAEKRRQVQLEVLKDSLSGNRNVSSHDQLNALCILPVLTDPLSADRIIRLVKKIKGA